MLHCTIGVKLGSAMNLQAASANQSVLYHFFPLPTRAILYLLTP